MKHAVDSSIELDERLNEYLLEHPGETVESLVRGVLEELMRGKLPRGLSQKDIKALEARDVAGYQTKPQTQDEFRF